MRMMANNQAANNPVPVYRNIPHALKSIYSSEGLNALYRGFGTSLAAGVTTYGTFFAIYADGKKRYGFDKDKPHKLKHIGLSFRAGIVSMLIAAPFWTIKTRMALF